MSLPKRKPVPFTNIPAEDDPVGTEILSVCRKEQSCFTASGSLSPRRQFNEDAAPSGWKHQLFQPKRPNGSEEVKESKSVVPAGLPKFRALFDALSKTEENPRDFLGLLLMYLVANQRDATVVWMPETELERNVRIRTEEFEAVQRSRTEHARQLLLEQIPSKSDREIFLEGYKASQLHYMYASETDAAKLSAYERQALQDEAKRVIAEQQKKQAGEMRKQQAREAMELRRREREARVHQLQDAEEDVRDTLDAVRKVRHRFDEEKASGMDTEL